MHINLSAEDHFVLIKCSYDITNFLIHSTYIYLWGNTLEVTKEGKAKALIKRSHINTSEKNYLKKWIL